MGKNDVAFKISGDSGDAQRAWLEVIGVMKQMQTELGRMGNKLEKETKNVSANIDKSVSALKRLQQGFQQFRNVLGIIGSVKQAFALLNQEMQAHKQFGTQQLDPNLRLQYAMRGVAQNTTPEEFQSVRKAIESYNGPLDRAQVAESVKYAISSVGLGFEKREVARGAVEIAERFPELAANGESSNLVTTGMLRLYGASPALQKTDAAGLPDYSTATAFFKGALQKSAQANPEDFAKYTAVAAAQLISSYGMKPEQAMAFLASTQEATGDITGRMGSRVALNVADDLNTIGTKYGVGGGNVFNVKEWMQKKTPQSQKAMEEFVGMFGSTRKLAGDLRGMESHEIEGALSTAAKYRVPLKEWITGTGKVGKTAAETEAALDVTRMARIEEERQAMFREDPYFELSRADIARRSAAGERQERQSRAARRGSYEATLAELQNIEGMPEGGWGRTLDTYMTPLGLGAFRNKEFQNHILQAKAKFLLRGQYLGVEGIPETWRRKRLEYA